MIVGKPLLTVKQIDEKVRELGRQISADYRGKELLVVPILKGAFMFASDLIKNITIPITVDFIIASSYIKTGSSGEVSLHYDVRDDVKGKDVLLIEDIVDTGITLNYVRERILKRGPNSVKICGMLNKKERRIVNIPVDYVGFEIPNYFVVGYGLDYEDKFRNMPNIAIFKKDI